jgi:predicted nucleic acid-binding Zn ribbon protein
MSLPQTPSPQPAAPAPRECPLCDTALSPNQLRCPSCGLYQELGPERPNPFRQGALWLLIGVLVAVYVAVLIIVAVIPAAH